jgi:hypothetical protein
VSCITGYCGAAAASFDGNALNITVRPESGKGVGGQAMRLAPLSGKGANILPESAAEELFGGDQIA